MNKIWCDRAWNNYLYWIENDKKIISKINKLVKDIERNGNANGIGHPEHLRYIDAWSRRINHENRLVYKIENGNLLILDCKGHYEK